MKITHVAVLRLDSPEVLSLPELLGDTVFIFNIDGKLRPTTYAVGLNLDEADTRAVLRTLNGDAEPEWVNIMPLAYSSKFSDGTELFGMCLNMSEEFDARDDASVEIYRHELRSICTMLDELISTSSNKSGTSTHNTKTVLYEVQL